MYNRICPVCQQAVEHKTESSRNQAIKNNRLCKSCAYKQRDQCGENNPFWGKTHTSETLEKIAARDVGFFRDPKYKKKRADAVQGKMNPMYGRCNYDVWIERYGKDEADKRQAASNKRLSEVFSGALNPMYGKPSPQGSGNGWSGWYNGWYFRSLRELFYVIHLEKSGLKWRTAERADLQVEYVDWRGTKRTYRADFLVEDKWLVEVKPSKLHSSRTVRAKAQAAEKFCALRGYEYKVEDPPQLSDDEIAVLHDSGNIKFLDKYELKFQERLRCKKK